MFRIKPHTRQRYLEDLNNTLGAAGSRDPTETDPDLPLSISCRGMGQQWPSTGAGALGTAVLCVA